MLLRVCISCGFYCSCIMLIDNVNKMEDSVCTVIYLFCCCCCCWTGVGAGGGGGGWMVLLIYAATDGRWCCAILRRGIGPSFRPLLHTYNVQGLRIK